MEGAQRALGRLFADHEHKMNQQLAHSAIANGFEIALCLEGVDQQVCHDEIMERAIEAAKLLAKMEQSGTAKWGVADGLPDWSEVCQSIANRIAEYRCTVDEQLIEALYQQELHSTQD
jgi:hypothetical protein